MTTTKADVDRVRDDRAHGRDGAYTLTIEEALGSDNGAERIAELRRVFVRHPEEFERIAAES